jgi:hypothetical protein
VSRAPVIPFEPIPYTAAEKEAIGKANAMSAPSVGMAGPAGEDKKALTSAFGDLFAPTKMPFDPTNIIVSSDGHVWVPRNQRFGIKTVLYDVFDRQGERVDRVELPAGNRIIGFGPNAVYAVERDEKGSVALRKYKL